MMLAADAVITPPQSCAASRPSEAFIRVVGTSSLPFSLASCGKATGCTRLGAFLDIVTRRLKARGTHAASGGAADSARERTLGDGAQVQT